MKKLTLQKFERIYKGQKRLFLDNLIGGIAWGIGSIIGAILIVTIIGILISRTDKVPILGDVVRVIVNDIEEGKNLSPLPTTGSD
jgi:hypothetical protein